MAKEKVVLAYSGGLDTSVCVKWLMDEKDLDVYCVVGEVGQEHDGLEKVRDRALEVGAKECRIVDMRQELADEYLDKALAANALYEGKYPLLSALTRPLISKHLVDIAHEVGAKYIAHGCTGKGNDQVRFETSIATLDPSIEIIAPVREWDLTTRESEMEYAAQHGVKIDVTKKSPYSIDDNLWGRAIECGVLEDPWNEPPDDIWTTTVDPEQAPDTPEVVDLEFKAGLPVAVNGEKMSYLDIIYRMNEIAGRNGYGRLDMVENRLVGLKSRECYEQPGALALITAHKALEDCCLELELMHYKPQLEAEWAILVYNGQWFSPLKNAIDAFMAYSQQCVTGTIRLKFYKGSCTVIGRKSEYSLYDHSLATYGEGDTFDRTLSKGFIQLYQLPVKVWAANRRENGVSE
ncbi:MAG: argininosuccinate synthase [Eggerthellaceae bacterium]|jgi:argininosuccinate synthase